MSKCHVVCFVCRQKAAPKANDVGDNEDVKFLFALMCPNIPQEVSPTGLTAAMLCPMAKARRDYLVRRRSVV